MAIAITACGKRMTVTEMVRHIPKCHTCYMWWSKR